MATVGINLVKDLAILSQGRKPGWAEQAFSDSSGYPSATSGVSVIDAIVSMVCVALRRDAAAHASRVTVVTADLVATAYTVTIDGNNVVYDAAVELPADDAALLQGIADAINADVTVGPIVTASVVDGVIVIVNDAGGDATHTTAVATSGGTGAMSFTEDATAASFRLWMRPDLSSAPWALVNSAAYSINQRGFIERFETSSASRLFVEVYSITGPSASGAEALILIGPGELE